MSSSMDDLIQLAQTQFPDLTIAEVQFLRAATLGRFAWYGDPAAEANNPLTAETSSQLPMIRAEVIRWLCMDQAILRYIDPKGPKLAKITFPSVRN